MKNLKSTALLALLTVCILHVSAQEKKFPLNDPNYSKPRVFTDLPDKMPLRMAGMQSLLDLPVGAKVNVAATENFSLTGTIISKSNPADANVKSVVVRCANRQGATFTFTRVTAADGTVSFKGRLLNKAGGDALEIAKEGETYVIRKKGTYEVIAE